MNRKQAVVKVMPREADCAADQRGAGCDRRKSEARRAVAARRSAWKRRCAISPAAIRADIGKIVNGAIYEVKYDEMVIVKDIEFFSMCEHHMLPFFGKMHIAYLARNKVIGLSKLPRIVDIFARRLQIQERLTQEVAQCIQDMLDPLGVGVIAEAQHFCMMMRGVEKQHSGTVTSTMLGAFRKNKETRNEFLALVKK